VNIANVNQKNKTKKENPIKTGLMILLLILIYIIAIPFMIPKLIHGFFLRSSFRKIAIKQGKFILFVYSDSPNWKPYIETNILPKVQEHATILNWSERSIWDNKSWAVRTFKHWGGQVDFNPVAIVFCNLLKVKVFRFYQPFLEYKHGKVNSLQTVETQLFELVHEIVKT
jgi:hypothetical protein